MLRSLFLSWGLLLYDSVQKYQIRFDTLMLGYVTMIWYGFIRHITVIVISQNWDNNSSRIVLLIFRQKKHNHSAELCIGMQWQVVISIVALYIAFEGQIIFRILWQSSRHNSGVIMSAMASRITSLTIVYSTIQQPSSASLSFVWGIHRCRWIPRTKGL